MRAKGGNPNFDIEIRNSRDHADPWGQPNVSRIIIGGSRTELGSADISFNGVAESIDPGNFDREETGLVLMDHTCAPSGTVPITANDFLGPESDVILGLGRAIGFVASHESGHFFGNWHTNSNNGVASIMDRFDLTQLGLGPDGLAGTDDDVDVDFVEDAFEAVERFVGLEDTLNRPAFALTTGQPGIPSAPDDVEAVATRRAVRVTWSGPAEPITGYVVRAMADGDVVATQHVAADDTRTRFRGLPAGTYTFTVAALNAVGEGPAGASPPITVNR